MYHIVFIRKCTAVWE